MCRYFERWQSNMSKNEPFCDISSLVFSFWRCGCSVSLAMETPLTQEGSRPPPSQPRELPPALRRVNLPLSPPQAATPWMDPGTIYHACSMDNYAFLFCFLQQGWIELRYLGHHEAGRHWTDQKLILESDVSIHSLHSLAPVNCSIPHNISTSVHQETIILFYKNIKNDENVLTVEGWKGE